MVFVGPVTGPRTGVSEWIVLDHCVGTCRFAFVVGNACSNRFCRICLLVGVRSSDDIVTFLGGTRHGRCSHVMVREIEIRVLDGFKTYSSRTQILCGVYTIDS
jgi:hypothetical protein